MLTNAIQIGMHLKTQLHTHTCTQIRTPMLTHQRIRIALQLLTLLIRSVCHQQQSNTCRFDRQTDRQTDRKMDRHIVVGTLALTETDFRILFLLFKVNNKFTSRQAKKESATTATAEPARVNRKTKPSHKKGKKDQCTK